jgi:hypothetical protein
MARGSVVMVLVIMMLFARLVTVCYQKEEARTPLMAFVQNAIKKLWMERIPSTEKNLNRPALIEDWP